MVSICAGYEWGKGDAHFDIDVVTGDDLLSANGANLDLHVDNVEGLGADVDLDKTEVHGLVELTKP